jgi:Actinobacteria/chloroflexi VLRF1 release factor
VTGAAPRRVVVTAERLEGFLGRIAERHGELTWLAAPAAVVVTAADGTTADCRVPFPPLTVDIAEPYGGLLAHVIQDRVVGVILARRGGYAAGVFEGTRLTTSKVGSRHVQGRSAAGGWSQQRFARRRDGQARVAMEAAADVAARVILPHVTSLDAVVVGGDRDSCDRVLADPRLAPLQGLLVEARIDVPDPRQKVLESTPQLFRSVHVTITSPNGAPSPKA